MEVLLSIATGFLFAVSIFLLLRRHMLRVVFGLILMTNAVNLLLLTLGGLTRAAPPTIPKGQTAPVEAIANPLPQALILTSIVISMGILAFMLLLVYRTEKAFDTIDVDDLQDEEPPDRAETVGSSGEER